MSHSSAPSMAVGIFCLHQVWRQHDEPIYVAGMYRAWQYACSVPPDYVCATDLRVMAAMIKRRPVVEHFRLYDNISVGGNVPPPAERVPELIDYMLDAQNRMTSDELAKEYLRIHPEEDGNGRVASLLINIKDRTLDKPRDLPDFDWGPQMVPMKVEG